jgi:hypothetical protein
VGVGPADGVEVGAGVADGVGVGVGFGVAVGVRVGVGVGFVPPPLLRVTFIEADPITELLVPKAFTETVWPPFATVVEFHVLIYGRS